MSIPAGDFNGDGLQDAIVWRNYITVAQVGIVFGDPEPRVVNWDNPLESRGVWILDDAILGSGKVTSGVSGGCDFNGDAYDDVVVGMHGGGTIGEDVMVVFGAADDADLDPYDLGDRGYRISGRSRDLECVDDINGDGIDEIVLTSPTITGSEVRVIFGKSDASDQIDPVLDGTDGFVIHAEADAPIDTVERVGDVDGDGSGDFVLHAWRYPLSIPGFLGRSYVLFDGVPDMLLADITAGVGDGYALLFDSESGSIISPVAVGDVDGDGNDDIGLGKSAAGTEIEGTELTERIYVAYGRDDSSPVDVEDDVVAGTDGFAFDLDGTSYVRNARDIDGDGTPDHLLMNSSLGVVRVQFGEALTGLHMLDGDEVLPGYTLSGAALTGSFYGHSMAGLGDFNGDGRADVAVSGGDDDGPEPRSVYILFSPQLDWLD